MYEQFYGLEKAPFNVTPDPDFLYPGPSHREMLASIAYGVDQRKGFIAILGDVGLGKTTVLRSYIETIDPTQLAVAYVFNANVSFKELLDTICRDLDIEHPPEDDEYGLVNRVHQFLLGEYHLGKNVVLVVDEAQNVPVDTLEKLRVLSNLESGQDKLLQMVLVGQQEFGATLEQHALRQLRQRIAVRCTLEPLTAEQSREYIEFRLNRAGASTPAVFTRAALNRIVAHARGIPRVLNIVCDNALVTGLGYQKKPVTLWIANEVIADLQGRRKARRRRWLWATAAAVLATAALPLAWPYRGVLAGNRPGVQASAPAPARVPPPTPDRVTPVQPASSQASTEPAAGRATATQAAGTAVGQPAVTEDSRLVVHPSEVTKVVVAGTTLRSMARQVYGFANDAVLRRVIEKNPAITNANVILVGSVIRFPDVSDLRPTKVPPGSAR